MGGTMLVRQPAGALRRGGAKHSTPNPKLQTLKPQQENPHPQRKETLPPIPQILTRLPKPNSTPDGRARIKWEDAGKLGRSRPIRIQHQNWTRNGAITHLSKS